jgi:hypothetical protein
MPVTVRAALLLVVALAAGCSGGGDPADAGSVDAGSSSDAGHTCFERDAGACTAQASCITTDSEASTHVYACLAGFCAVQGHFGATGCQYEEPTVLVQVAKSPAMAASPGSIELRAFYPTNVDGTALSCADLLGASDFPDGGSPLDVNPNFNVQSVGAYAASCAAGSGCVYVLSTNLVGGTAPLLLAQAYTGGRDVTGVHALGAKLGEGCVVADTVTESNQTFNLTVAP